MQWRGRRQSDNIEDRRGMSTGGMGGGGGFRLPTGGRGGGIGIGGLVVILLISWALGINPLTLLSGGDTYSDSGSQQQQTGTRPQGQSSDETTAFVRTILAETEDTWGKIFQASGETYQKPTLVLFSGQVRSACGNATSASGPFYCPVDRKVYLDTDFFRELSQRFGASGDFAQAYVIAHEVGHHVQNLTGVLPEFNQRRQSMSESQANALSVKVELQADCYAGIWGKSTQQKGILEAGDLEEALNAAHQIGDDTLQKKTQGYVVPDSFNHGTSAQRVEWFRRGFESGRVEDCDTFSADI
ncbi:MAG: zinc metallopeptidase [Agrobacterium cavarae]|jgi:predicted metalloprotease|uniref:Flagellar biosynthesis protein FlgM n=2 Tax=Rhizobium/Agrobacterium group TaxID=227290 RepID=A0AA92HAT3_RHIRH|nr:MULTISPECIES: neutral zinc metallopeptidase [Rhizobium/Agrobacterium group]KQR33611.1 flagellar biosynthesis protein FlgM [Rhizobium sp. Leaf155]KQZ95595.1 flagellar biosynthesis protein FlgM [Rhizobium sp. Root564]MDP9572447.1 putative metalloprotease [Agrobacterium larrymoorei]PVE68693.1 flagellar biosynthesis protein FlgM [Agrobacterium tumefaciens]PVE78441.1 flagellar biosynthesis protein FlgM [Sphingomonas sp. TPD3009]